MDKPFTSVTEEQLKEGRLRAKQAQRPFRIKIDGITASAKIASEKQFVDLIRLLRLNDSFHPSVLQVERLQAELRRVHGVGLPVPEEVLQRPEPALVICWGQLSVIAFEGGIGSLVGGAGGNPEPGITPQLLEALALRVRMSC